MKNLKALLFLIPLFLISCAKPVALVLNYSDDTSAKGTAMIVPSRPISGTKLVVNGKLLVENDSQSVKSITIKNMPDGEYSYRMTCENSKLKHELDATNQFTVKGEKELAFLHELPPYSSGYWVNQGLYQLGTWAALLVLLTVEW